MIEDTEAAQTRLAHKRFETLQARLALRNFVLRPLDGGTFRVSQWQLSRELSDMDAVERFCGLVGA